MADAYDGNGEYGNFGEEDEYNNGSGGSGGSVAAGKQQQQQQQRKAPTSLGSVGVPSAMGGPLVPTTVAGSHNGDGGIVALAVSGSEGNHLNEKAHEYIRDCLNEKARMERKYPIAERLLDTEIEKVQTTGRIPSKEQKYADIYREKPIRISQKVLVPIREHPKFNFVGKLLGPKGNSLRRLQEETLCKMTVLGRNSMRDRVKEEELRNSKDPKYAHLNSDLHVEISTVAPPAEAFARIAYAMAELRKYLIPDSNDIIRQEQLRELMDNAHLAEESKSQTMAGGTFPKKMSNPGLAGHQGPGTPGGGGGSGGGNVVANMGGGPVTGGGMGNMSKGTLPPSVASGSSGGYRVGGGNPQQHLNAYVKSVSMAPKQKVMSILEKARSAMEETYGRNFDNDGLTYDNSHTYDPYNYGHNAPPIHNHAPAQHSSQNSNVGTGGLTTRGPYDNSADYNEVEYARRGDYYQHSPGYGDTQHYNKIQQVELETSFFSALKDLLAKMAEGRDSHL